MFPCKLFVFASFHVVDLFQSINYMYFGSKRKEARKVQRVLPQQYEGVSANGPVYVSGSPIFELCV